jgi:hypothetical protein
LKFDQGQTLKFLVAYSSSSVFVQTTRDYLLAFKKYSEFEVYYINVTHVDQLDLELSEYDAVFHSYCARFAVKDYVDHRYVEQLRAYDGVKILAVQDEYDHTDLVKAAIKECSFDIVLTCVPQSSLDYVYPSHEFSGVVFLTVFTGYAPDDYLVWRPLLKPLSERPIALGYRGRDIGGRYGRLGFDKFEIGRRMKDICAERGIVHDIAVDDQSRIYGRAWFEFIGNCRVMLGSESGSNVFDFDGSIAALHTKVQAANEGSAPTYEEFLPYVADREREIEMGQISPRIFECAVMYTPMVLFRGRYSDVLEPDEHYIALEKDFSNIDEVLRRLEDFPALEQLANRAFDHLVGSGTFGYRAFVERVANETVALAELKGYRRVDSAQRTFLSQLNWRDRCRIDQPTPFISESWEFQARHNIKTATAVASNVAALDKAVVENAATWNRMLDVKLRSLQARLDGKHASKQEPEVRRCVEGLQSFIARLKAGAQEVEDSRERYVGLRGTLIHSIDFAGYPDKGVDILRIANEWYELEMQRNEFLNTFLSSMSGDVRSAMNKARGFDPAPRRLFTKALILVSLLLNPAFFAVLRLAPWLRPPARRVKLWIITRFLTP